MSSLNISGVRKIAFILMLFIGFSGIAQAQKSGAHYWGDSDGNGIIEIPDLSSLINVLGNPAFVDATLYADHPQSRYRQDLDGNGLIEVPDYSVLLGWVTGNFSNRPGNPDQLLLDGVSFNVATGDSVTLSAYGLSPLVQGAKVRTGLGVIFKVDPSGTCTTAEIFGYDTAGGNTVNGWRTPAAYHYSSPPGAPDDGRATVRVRPTGCTSGQTIMVEVYIPADSESNAVAGRFPLKLPATQLVTINVISSCQQVIAIDVKPDDPTINEGESLPFSATCTLADSSTVDCTSSYCGTATGWTVAGHLNQLVPSNLVEAQAGVGAGTVTTDFDDGLYPPISDISNVTVTDVTPPETNLTSTPPDPSNSADATFGFDCSEAGCSFECQLDGGGWSVCTSPKSYTGLAEGSHAFEVRSIDAAGNPDASPVSYSWSISTTPPDTTIDYGPSNPTNSPDASFGFSCTGGPCAYECQQDGGGYSSCTSPKDYTGLADGSHTFMVRAINAAGNPDPTPASYNWTVDRTEPNTFIDSFPANPTYSSTVDFAFSSNEAGSTFECQMDAGGWSPCISLKNYTGLAAGSHTFEVRATDLVGNTDSVPASYTWDIRLDLWGTVALTNAPAGRYWHTAVWTGAVMIVWGGNSGGTTILNTGGRYDPVTDTWTATTTTGAAAARYDHTAVWANGPNVMIVWGGNDGGGALRNGSRYNPTTNSWAATTNGGRPTARYWNSAVWTGSVMILWGGYDGTSVTNTGSRYDPMANSWDATTTTAAPGARSRHIAVWTGVEMIVWSGRDNTNHFNTGGRYNPTSNSWVATSTTNAPTARRWPIAVWTGTRMIVWGGIDGTPAWFDSGGIYDPAANSWTATSLTNAPSARVWHAGVWTGTQLVVWGGYNGTTPFNTGGVYNPTTNSWRATRTVNAPTARYDHTAVWTGTEMIIWGGWNGAAVYNDGGRLTPAP